VKQGMVQWMCPSARSLPVCSRVVSLNIYTSRPRIPSYHEMNEVAYRQKFSALEIDFVSLDTLTCFILGNTHVFVAHRVTVTNIVSVNKEFSTF